MTLKLLILTIIVHFVQLVTIMTLAVIRLVIFVNCSIYPKASITVQVTMRKCAPVCSLEK